MECRSDYFHHHYNIPDAQYAYLYSPVSSPMHRHEDFYEFSLVTQGSFVNEHNGQRTLLHKNSLIYFRCGEAHSIMTDNKTSLHFTVTFKKDFFEKLCRQFFLNTDIFFENSCIITHLTDLKGEFLNEAFRTVYMHSPTPVLHDDTRFFFFNLMGLIQLPVLDEPKERAVDRYVDTLLTNLNNYAYQNIRISEIYQNFPLAHTTLINSFRKRTGYTIEQYLGMKRMERAAILLRDSSKSISDISAEIGFSSESHFIQKFKKYHGMTPKEYQRISHMDNSVLSLAGIKLPKAKPEPKTDNK